MRFNQSLAVITGVSLFSLVGLSGCQSMHTQSIPKQPQPVISTTSPNAIAISQQPVQVTPIAPPTPTGQLLPQKFSINGKIGLTTPKQAGSAFYVWSQNGKAFGIDLSGVMNAGQTNITYNGQTATLTNDKGTLTADNPEALLFKATGWQAPISQLPYWIMGQSAPSDSNDKSDSNSRLLTAYNGDWTADFNYATDNDKLPNRITMRHPEGYKVVLTINRLS